MDCQYDFHIPKVGRKSNNIWSRSCTFTELIKLPEMYRSENNYNKFFARRQIGEELGLLDKDLTLDDLEKSEYE